ncbi:hypothetical protein [Cohnella herbarum]|uniref:SIR2-like domain-containing protein n=1 Tax=Cohnella herbarum TaxID=2728023 RepID=A0A7Z2VI35_9BACL|nr:hypothetical protein [Cohnella herbarum]QJD83279.1 hypothetical protein HH215_08915 [Cohnella herbarum]QJD88615.1 hypothetical protein HH215_35855 [Cohnella herbarum]
MVENVFILGAGASFESGAPLMNNFLDISEELLMTNVLNEKREAFQEVFSIISDLQIIHSKSYLKLDNIETLFGAIEMARIINRLGTRTGNEIEVARESLIKLIVKTLEKTIKLPASDKHIRPTKSYLEFANLINDLQASNSNNSTSSIISFNYDVALDFALHYTSQSPDYCLSHSNDRSRLHYLKLHGSINWGRCKHCKEVLPYNFNDYFRKYNWSRLLGEVKNVLLTPSEHLHDLSHCNESVENIPVIVPPTWNKTDYQGTLTNVWTQAAEDLSTARNIFVIGYSLPESDAFFRYLFALGTAGKSRIKRFMVFDPNNTGEIKGRYETLIGRGIYDRFEYREMKFSEATPFIRNILNVKENKY